ncbi:lipid II:glycine glycyltransferase FemX [Macrococcus equipercicus]|uniref:Lipid II:glycine glycyltransferase n=1 Tax=Macrococcus equipercicus TaxID=69967 RepID=A0A9Q9F1F4_9STAP|nr:lipid II:glycine glycyltransferase FemX [Macrococcus equipercicus]KAA1039662.1 N-acetyltransferase [Macrococcus equipercicus]UTH13993.1 lipid II:glycine glycyltransferase FemX [Macrococcus equipercicus]
MTVKRLHISNDIHDQFVKQHPNGDLLQLSKWAESKRLTGWYAKRIAVGRDNEVAGVGQLLFKRVPRLPFTLCYISRGFVCDYNDKEVVAALTKFAVEVARAERAYAIKIDPDIEVENAGNLVDYMESLGYRHKGFEDGLSKSYIQPRMTMITDIDQDDEALIQSFEKNNRSRVKLSQKKGTEAYIAGRDDLKTFAALMKETGERDGFLTRDVSYFENIYDALNPDGDAELFLVKLIPAAVIPKLQEEYDALESKKQKLEQKKDQKKAQNQLKDIALQQTKLQKQLAELEQLNETNPEGKVLSGALLTFSGHKSYYLYGASSNEYRDYLPNHNMQISMMRYARERGAKSYDFGGTDNNPPQGSEHFGLWQFKKMWGTRLSEKIGEFDYVLNQPVYRLIEQVKPRVTKMKLKFTKGRKK